MKGASVTYRQANGGSLWHMLRGESARAVCGFAPASDHHSYWATLPQARPGARVCPRCQQGEAQARPVSLMPLARQIVDAVLLALEDGSGPCDWQHSDDEAAMREQLTAVVARVLEGWKKGE